MASSYHNLKEQSPQRQSPPRRNQTQSLSRRRLPCVVMEEESNAYENVSLTRSNAEKPLHRRRRLTFDTNLCVYYPGADLALQQEHRVIWYSPADLTQMRRQALSVAKQADRTGFGSLLTNTYGKSCPETVACLTQWCSGTSSTAASNESPRRGLERWANDEYAAKRSDIRKRTIRSVLRAQQKMRQDVHDNRVENVVDYQWKVLARLSTAFSQDSTTFARVMGMADERAVEALEEDDDKQSPTCSPPPQQQQLRDHSAPTRRRSGKVSRTRSPRSVLMPHQYATRPLEESQQDFLHYF